jgi:hypothetical protein
LLVYLYPQHFNDFEELPTAITTKKWDATLSKVTAQQFSVFILIFLLPKLQSLDRLATFIFSFELGEKILF